MQYLFGLSVVEVVRSLPGYEDLGLWLKWPNDIYADLGDEHGGLKKIGGILVNSIYAGADFTVIIGTLAVFAVIQVRSADERLLRTDRLWDQHY